MVWTEDSSDDLVRYVNLGVLTRGRGDGNGDVIGETSSTLIENVVSPRPKDFGQIATVYIKEKLLQLADFWFDRGLDSGLNEATNAKNRVPMPR